MQLFLPYPSITQSVQCLDNRRLMKQIVEASQIVDAIMHDTGWRHHPIVRALRHHVDFVIEYGYVANAEWRGRGYQPVKFPHDRPGTYTTPPFVGIDIFHLSHRANLVRKAPDHYVQYFGRLPDSPYLWPVVDDKGTLVHFRYGNTGFVVAVDAPAPFPTSSETAAETVAEAVEGTLDA